jgi:nicotinamide-nucleotide amidase
MLHSAARGVRRENVGVSVRAGILVTGTEVLSGYVMDRNGPWLSERLADLGVEVEEITVVGDRAEDLEGALRHMRDQGLDLVVTSGGLGPTADDLTAELVRRFALWDLVF